MKFAPMPLNLKFLSVCHTTAHNAYSICNDATGKEIYVAGLDRITRYSQDMTMLATLDTHGWTSSIITSGNNVYFVQYVQSDWILMKASSNLTNPIQIAKFVNTSRIAKYITINQGSIITAQRDIESIHVYNVAADNSNMIQLKFAPRVVSTHPDGDLLITDKHGSLHKCRIKSTDAVEVIWSYSGLQDAYGICTMDNGFIVTLTPKGSRMHVISTEGEQDIWQ